MAAVAVATTAIVNNVAFDTNVGAAIFKAIVIPCRQQQLLLILLLYQFIWSYVTAAAVVQTEMKQD